MRIGIIGCAGRMGRANLAAVLAKDGVELAGGIEAAGNPALGQDLGALAGVDPIGMNVGSDLNALLSRSHVVIEFSTVESSLVHAKACAEAGCAHVIGTTGLTSADERELAAIAERTPIVWGRNMSLGVNLLQGLVEKVARVLDADFDIEIVEMHHRRKVDAPSGTALALGEAAARGRGIELEANADRVRDGITGARERGRIGFATLRGGDVIGDHSVIFASEGERIELTHKASGRQIYARGAVQAAIWAADKTPGLYSMTQVLGLD